MEHELEKIKSLKYFPELNEVIIILEGGDLYKISFDPNGSNNNSPEILLIGSIDEKISCAEWSPDDEILIILSKNGKINFMSKYFELISEYQLSDDDFKKSKHVSVGWGKSETQFKGKGAKTIESPTQLALIRTAMAASGGGIDDVNSIIRDPTLPDKFISGSISEFDDSKSRISWRGDAEYVSINWHNGDLSSRRAIRVFNREGKLDSVSEPVDGQEGQLAWRPSGNLIASVQRSNDNLDLIFFERNGLRHGEFSLRLPPSQIIHEIAWNSDSEVLAVLCDDKIQLWTTKNYYWYLKYVIPTTNAGVSILWHPEKALTLLIQQDDSMIETHTFSWTIISGPTQIPNDLGTIAVIDGQEVKITPLKIANVPPPMSYRSFESDAEVLSVAISKSNDLFASLTHYGISLYKWDLTNPKKIQDPKLVGEISNALFGDFGSYPRQIVFIGNNTIITAGSEILLFDITDLKFPEVLGVINVGMDILLIKSQNDFESIIFETVDGSIYEISSKDLTTADFLVKLPQRCSSLFLSNSNSNDNNNNNNDDDDEKNEKMVFGLTDNGKLFINNRLLTNSVTSILMTESHLILTTAQHFLKFIHLNTSPELIQVSSDNNNQNSNDNEKIITEDERCRSIERGSILISAIPSKTSIILQAPRGNLETISPRIMVVNQIRRNIDNLKYDKAFEICRIHRVDLGLLYDYDRLKFHNNVSLFIDQIGNVQYLDLFLSTLTEEDVTKTKYKETFKNQNININLIPEFSKLKISNNNDNDNSNQIQKSKINIICDTIVEVLLTDKYKEKYFQSILTAYACKKPPALKDALQIIGNLTITNPDKAEKAIAHLSILDDVNLLYKTSLGSYNIPLTVLIAQQSQQDPKEYLPFLQSLFEKEEIRRKFEIDTYLKNYTKALEYLNELNNKNQLIDSNEFNNYIVEHELYQNALNLCQYDTIRTNEILSLYANYLQGKREYNEAAIIFEFINNLEDAAFCYQLSGQWKECLSIIEIISNDKLKEIASILSDSLIESHKFIDAATINIDYLNNIDEGVRLLCEGYQYNEAIRISINKNSKHLLETIIDNGLTEGFSTIAELIADCKKQIDSQLRRLRLLRTKKEEDPSSFFNNPDENDTPDNVSVAASETSTAPSFFTRYTGKTGTTAKTGTSRKTAKNKRRQDRKRARGKQGTIYEEEYLINSMSRLADRLNQTNLDAVNLIEGLIRRNKKDLAYQLQKSYVEVLETLNGCVDEVFTMSEKDRERYDDDGNIYYIPIIPIPRIIQFPTKKILEY